MVKKGEFAGSRVQNQGFDVLYQGTPPWDIGRPQPEIIQREKDGLIQGQVLDVGCGTGENALYLSKLGYQVWGIDSSPQAIAKANQKAQERQLSAHFKVLDAFNLEELNQHFDTVIDSGLFHVFSDEARSKFVHSLSQVVKSGGNYLMICFSDREPGDWGPRRIQQEEILQSFNHGWQVKEIREAQFETTFDEPLVQAWLAIITRL